MVIDAEAAGREQEPTVDPPMTPAIQPPATPQTTPIVTTTAPWAPSLEPVARTNPFSPGASADAAHQQEPSNETHNWRDTRRSEWSLVGRHADRWEHSDAWWQSTYENDANVARANQSLIADSERSWWQSSYDGNRWSSNDNRWDRNDANNDGWDSNANQTPYPSSNIHWQQSDHPGYREHITRSRFHDVRRDQNQR